MAKFLTIFAIAIISSGCCTVPPHVPFECPDRFEFAEYDELTWELASEFCEEGDTTVCRFIRQAQTNITADDLAMKEYILACEARQEIHNAE